MKTLIYWIKLYKRENNTCLADNFLKIRHNSAISVANVTSVSKTITYNGKSFKILSVLDEVLLQFSCYNQK